MVDYLDRLLAADDEVSTGTPFPQCPSANVGLVVGARAASSAALEAEEMHMLGERLEIEFREPDRLTIAEYERAKAAGLLSPDDEELILTDLMTRILYL